MGSWSKFKQKICNKPIKIDRMLLSLPKNSSLQFGNIIIIYLVLYLVIVRIIFFQLITIEMFFCTVFEISKLNIKSVMKGSALKIA